MDVENDTIASFAEQSVYPGSLPHDAIGEAEAVQHGEARGLNHQPRADWLWFFEAFEQGDFVPLPGKQERGS